MAATASLPSSSLSPSQSLSSSQSSEGSCSFVVVEKTSSMDKNAQVSQLNGEEKQEVKLKNESPVEAGSASHEDLIQRVQGLTLENEELKGVLVQNNKLLEEYFQDLAGMQKNQKQANETLRKGYDQAKEVVKKLREKNQSLKTELKSEQIKNQQLEEQMKKFKEDKLNQSSSEVESKPSTPKQLQSLNQEIKRLEGEKAMLEINNSKLQEHISCLRTSLHEAEKSTMEGDECETLVSMGSLIPSSDQTSMESMQSRYSKLETDKEILLVDLQKITIEKEQIQQQYQNLEEEHKLLTKHLAELEQIKTLDNAAVVESGQVTELSCQLQKQTESLKTLKEELDSVKEERVEFKKRVDELVDELTKERSKAERTLLQANHSSSETTQHVEQEGADIKKLNEEIFNLTHERDSYKKELDALQTHLEAAKASAEDAFGKVEDTEMNKKYTELKHQVLMFEKREAEILARENALLQEKEEAQRRESAENEEIEQMEQLLQNYKDKEKMAQEAVKQHLASQAKLGDEVGKLRQQMETEKLEFQKQLDDLMQERDTYKAKAEEMHTPTSEDKPSQEEVLGDADLKEEYLRVKKQLWKYQERDNYIQDKEKALLEKEKAYTQTLVKQGKDLQRQLAEVSVKEEALTQEKQRHEEEIKILKKQLGETHEHEVLLLKEDLHTKSQEMAAVQTNEKCLREQLLKLQLENQNLVVECEKCRADCKKQENLYQDHLHKVTQDIEHQRSKRDDIIKALRTQLATTEKEFHKAQAHIDKSNASTQDLHSKLEQLRAKNQELVESHNSVLDSNKPSQEEVLGDADLKEKYLRVKKQLWKYQERDNYIQDKENALLEKEKAYTQTLVKQGKDLQRQLAEVRVKEEALTQEKQRHEEEIKILKKQLGETYEHEVLLLKEDLHTKSQAMAAVQTNEKCLKEQLLKLQLENQNLSVECEKCRADCKRQEEETQSVKRRLSETHEQEYLLLKEQLRNKELALETSQTSEEHMKAQVTQLIQENDSLGIELERLKEDLQQQENLYQDHLHKVTQDSEHQRSKRDDMIKALRTQLATNEKEFHKCRAHIDKSNASTRDLQSKLEQLRAENKELVESYNSVLDSNKRHERNEEDLAIHLRESDRLVEKLKEDAALKERELNELKEERYDLEKQQEEKNQILNHQLEVYKRDFEAERAARETEHGEKLQLRDDIRQLQQENQYFQDQMDRLGNLQMHEMQRRHGSYVPEAHESQQQRGWFDFPLGYFGGRQDEIPRNPEGHRQEEPAVFGPQGDWICPTCHRSFDDFNTLQLHAVGCNGVSPAPVNQCPICMEVFPEIDTLEIHAQECGN